jgi:two-component system cell cycle response regulator
MDTRHENGGGGTCLHWESSVDPSEALRFLEAAGLEPRQATEDPDCRVIDADRGASAGGVLSSAAGWEVPILLIVPDAAEETRALLDLARSHVVSDTCRREVAEAQAGARILRLLRFARNAQPDALTGLMNRPTFNQILDSLLADAGPESRVVLILANLDNFKRFNDQWGHAAGDSVLREVASVIRSGAAGAAAIGRTSGDGFAVVTRVPLAQAAALAGFLREQIAAHPVRFAGEEVDPVTASFGVAESSGGLGREDLYQLADRCVGAAKVTGRNRVVTAEQFAEEAEEAGEDPAIRDFENHVRLVTERLVASLTTRSRRMAGRFQDEAEHDGLTGLFIRRYFDRRLARDLENARRRERPLALIFLDVDHFGDVNRSYGFPTGDRALRHVAAVVREAVRTVDWVARYGGEEFTVVLPDTGLAEACEVAERIRLRLEESELSAYDGRRLTLTASLGVAERAAEDGSLVDFVQRASDRTREAKRAGRNAVRW